MARHDRLRLVSGSTRFLRIVGYAGRVGVFEYTQVCPMTWFSGMEEQSRGRRSVR